ncbi:419_t:CDS:2 [Ambispora gerdemannii]|uniref:419_t:CDS:1 n=1 Tax=Ambispora gerdemannii TaxID=144530 RepID=A0A9N8WUW5_9GLOM|nr:419_t:CDS:2 [Ambispora gerdemannii]
MTEVMTKEQQLVHDNEQQHILVDTIAAHSPSSNNDNNVSLEETLKTTPLKNMVVLSKEFPKEGDDTNHGKGEEPKTNGYDVKRENGRDINIGSGIEINNDLKLDTTAAAINPSIETVVTVLKEEIVVDKDNGREHHTSTEIVSLKEKVEVQEDAIVESTNMKKLAEIDEEVDGKLTSNITVISTPETETIVEKVEKTTVNKNVTNTLAYEKKVVEGTPGHETIVESKSTNEKIIDTDKYHSVVEKVTIKDSIEDDVEVETVKVEKTKIDHNPVTDETTVEKECNEQSMVKTFDHVVTLNQKEVINEVITKKEVIDVDQDENTESKLCDFEMIAESMKKEDEQVVPETPSHVQHSSHIMSPERLPQASPLVPRNLNIVFPLNDENDDDDDYILDQSDEENNPEISQEFEKIRKEINKQTESLRKEVNRIRHRVNETNVNSRDQEGESSTPVFRVQTLLDSISHSPSSIMTDVVESMFNPGFNSNVILFLNIIFLLLFASLMFLIIVTDYNMHVIAFLGLSFCLFIAINWFVASVAQAQLEEAKIVVAPAGSTEKQE